MYIKKNIFFKKINNITNSGNNKNIIKPNIRDISVLETKNIKKMIKKYHLFKIFWKKIIYFYKIYFL